MSRRQASQVDGLRHRLASRRRGMKSRQLGKICHGVQKNLPGQVADHVADGLARDVGRRLSKQPLTDLDWITLLAERDQRPIAGGSRQDRLTAGQRHTELVGVNGRRRAQLSRWRCVDRWRGRGADGGHIAWWWTAATDPIATVARGCRNVAAVAEIGKPGMKLWLGDWRVVLRPSTGSRGTGLGNWCQLRLSRAGLLVRAGFGGRWGIATRQRSCPGIGRCDVNRAG